MALRLSLSLGLFIGSLISGWWLGRWGLLTETRATRIVRFLVKGPAVAVLCFLFWGMDLKQWQLWSLPLLGMTLAVSTLIPAIFCARALKLSRPQTGSFLTCALFSNLGYFGAFTAFALFGEAAYGLATLHLAFFSPCYYTLGFWIAGHYGRSASHSTPTDSTQSELRFYPFIGMALGIVLSLAEVPRPDLLEAVNHLLIPVDTALYLMAIGSRLTVESPRPWASACWAMSAIKFLYTPLVAWLLVSLFHIHGLTRQVILLLASTPVAVSPLVFPSLFGIDRKLSNALWLFTTLLAIFWFVFILPLYVPR